MKNFKESGIEWLGEIPEHWEVVKINKIVTFVNGYAFENFDFNPIFEIPVIRIGDMQKEKILYDNCLKTKEKEKLKQFLISNNDILIALSGATTGKIAFCNTDNKAYINQRVAIVRSKLKLVKYYFLTRGFSLLIELACNGSAQPNISTKEIGEFKIPLPPLKEQEQIANFLDEKCEQIANFTEKKEKLITLLKEQKQALINETITKGLDKNINFKDSGIEWLGEIPQHWEVVKIKFLAIFYTGDSIKDSEKHKYCFLNNSIPYISTKDIDINTNVIDYNNGMFIEKNDANFKRAYTNSILLCLEGANAGKKIAFLDKEVCFVNKLCCISSKTKKLNSKFLFYFLQSVFFKNVFIANIKGLIGGITTDQLGNFYMLFPPLKEQEQIANFLDEKCKK
ncbi:TPA: restriction endonuclease subunit S [Campylobacter jejuni]|nr:restriction endonuclease subunit S [Campylobacter jejuni]HEF1774034.1 restriction endonuclease subunit S [Campylobacter jejuni]